ncbi:hypothetical protein V2J09_011370, partial [Rumex salicifolius]
TVVKLVIGAESGLFCVDKPIEVHTDTCINLGLPSPSCHLPPPPPHSGGERPPPLTSSPLSLFSTSTHHHSTLDLPGMLGMSLVSSFFICDRSTSQCFPTVSAAFYLDHVSVSSKTLVQNIELRNPSRLYWANNQSCRRLLRSTEQNAEIKLSDEDSKSWETCREVVSEFGFTLEEQNKILGKAFGHIHSPYWSEERKVVVPKLDVVSEILDYLRSLSLSDDDLRKVLKKFPEVLGCNLEDELKNNVTALEKNWGIKGKTLKNLLVRNPKVLGFTVDCKGDCIAQCTRCWARFDP